MDASVMRKACVLIGMGICLTVAGPAGAVLNQHFDTSYNISWALDYDDEFDSGPTALRSIEYAGSGSSVLPQFDPNLGTLQKVHVSYSYQLLGDGAWTQADGPDSATDGWVAWDNEAETHPTVALEIDVQIGLVVPQDDLFASSYFDGSQGVGVDSEAGAADYKGSDAYGIGISDDASQQTGGDNVTMEPGTFDLSDYIGTGTFDVSSAGALTMLIARTYDSGIGETPADDDGETDYAVPGAKVTVDVTYEYVPEPATMAVLLFGGSAVLWRRRR